MIQINILAGSLALFAISVNAGPCHPSVTTAVTSTSPSTTETSAAAATSSAAPGTCTVESPQYGSAGGQFEVYCDTVAGSTSPIGSFTFDLTFPGCLDHCDNTPDCQGVNYVSTGTHPMCIIWSRMGGFSESKGVTAARRIIRPQDPESV